MTKSHNNITCPKCHSAFSIDKSDYALISQQVRTKEFNSELEKKVQSELTKSMKIKENELDHKYQKQILEKVNLITQLRNDIKLQEEQHKNNKKNIYGKATQDEKEELKEEGIDLVNIPWVDKDN